MGVEGEREWNEKESIDIRIGERESKMECW